MKIEGMPVLVIGGGIGGLAMAGALSRAGAAVDVIERAPRWEPLGAGLVLGANAQRVLDVLGFKAALNACGQPLSVMQLQDARGGRLQRMDMSALGTEFPPPLAVHRAELQQVLLAGVDESRVVFDASIEHIECSADSVIATRTDGHRGEYALVIGADGLRSRVRQLAFSAAGANVRYAGYTCWRTVMPNVSGLTDVIEMWGRGRRVGLVPLRGGRLYVFLTENAPPRGQDPAVRRNTSVAERFREFAGEARPVLDALSASTDLPLMRHDIEELASQVWGNDRIALIGDASHATTPNLGQGAAMALEDVLALLLALRDESTVNAAVKAYEADRASRVAAIVRTSRQLGVMGQWSSAFGAAVARTVMRCTPNRVSYRAMQRMLAPGMALAERGQQRLHARSTSSF
jgi:2-polyprenyl-6-methoxyphenol hydroxylase-like FAD-dependent oxidoreductase